MDRRWFCISILGTEVLLLAVLMSVCDRCLSADKLGPYHKQVVVMHGLQARMPPKTWDAQEQLCSPGSSRQRCLLEYYHQMWFGESTDAGFVLCSPGLYGGEWLTGDPKPIVSTKNQRQLGWKDL